MNITQIKQAAEHRLSAAPGAPYKLTLMYAGISAGAGVLVTAVGYLLAREIDSTGGLAGIGTRTVLSVIRTMLTLIFTAAIPFWDMGYVRSALGFARGEQTGLRTLLEGFRRCGAVLRLLLLRSLLYTALAFLCLQLSSVLFALSPLGLSAIEAMDAAMAEGVQSEVQLMEMILPTLWPVYILFGVVLCVVVIPVFYRLRLTDFLIMDGNDRALAAMAGSSRAMRGNRISFFRLDLHFWWYYALQLLSTALAYGDTVLSAAGLPVQGDVWYFVFVLLSAVAQVLITWRFAPYVQTAYATAYDALRDGANTQPKPAEPKNLPW